MGLTLAFLPFCWGGFFGFEANLMQGGAGLAGRSVNLDVLEHGDGSGRMGEFEVFKFDHLLVGSAGDEVEDSCEDKQS
jgi:hypothetical protein